MGLHFSWPSKLQLQTSITGGPPILPQNVGLNFFFIFFISFLVDDYQLSCHEVFDVVGGGSI
jgi:hypothetical protein